jgi:hypothetical protein
MCSVLLVLLIMPWQWQGYHGHEILSGPLGRTETAPRTQTQSQATFSPAQAHGLPTTGGTPTPSKGPGPGHGLRSRTGRSRLVRSSQPPRAPAREAQEAPPVREAEPPGPTTTASTTSLLCRQCL